MNENDILTKEQEEKVVEVMAKADQIATNIVNKYSWMSVFTSLICIAVNAVFAHSWLFLALIWIPTLLMVVYLVDKECKTESQKMAKEIMKILEG